MDVARTPLMKGLSLFVHGLEKEGVEGVEALRVLKEIRRSDSDGILDFQGGFASAAHCIWRD